MKKYISFLICCFIIVASVCVAKDNSLDSLKRVLANSNEDSTKVNTLIAISRNLISNSDPNAIDYGIQARDLAKKINYKKGLAFALKAIGLLYNNQGKYFETLDYWQQSLETFESIGDKRGVANMLNNIGAVYFEQSDDAKSLEYYLKSLKISEEINDTLRITTALTNIGAVYYKKKQTKNKAKEYYLRALPLSEDLKDQDAIGTVSVNLGEIYLDKSAYDSALFYFEKSLKAYENTEGNMPYLLNDFGKVYDKKGDYKKAIEYQQKAIEIAKRLDQKLDMAQGLIGLGQTYFDLGDIKSSLSSYKEAEILTTEIGARLELKDAYAGLANSYAEFSDYVNAYKYQLLLNNIKDTLYNVETDKKLGALQFDFDIQKKQSQINLLTKDKKIQEADLKRQTVIKNVTISGLGIVLLFLIVVFFQKKKITLEKQRSEALLLNILPAETAEELKATGTAKAKSFDMVTVMFTDFKNFTQASEKLSAEELVHEINICYSEFDKIISKYSIEKIKTIGDSYMCAGGLPATSATHPEDVVKAGLEMQRFIEKNKAARIEIGQPFFELRLGIHTGPVVAGIVGIKKFAYDIWGDTVNTASRMESSGETGKVNVSGTTYELVKDKFICIHRGKIKAKNKGEIDMYFIEGELNAVNANEPMLTL